MKIISLLNMVKTIITTLIVAFSLTLGYSQNAQIKITQLSIQDIVVINSATPVTGYFKNESNTVFTGDLGIHVHVKDDPTSGAGQYYSSEVYHIGTYTLQPGEEVFFSTSINIVSSIFKPNSKDVIIIFPRTGNEVDYQNGLTREVEVTPQPSVGN